jgi:hypothetical protein
LEAEIKSGQVRCPYKRMMDNMDSQKDKMEACLEKKTTDLEAYPEEIESER